MKPTVGRIVHFCDPQEGTRAALIADVENVEHEILTLCVFGKEGIRYVHGVSKGERSGQWDWMPYQKGQAKKTEELERQLINQLKRQESYG